ncbi:MAG: O-antigen ligase family protein [Silvibacterium sp.]
MTLAFIVLAVVLILAVRGFSDPFMAFLAFVTNYELQPGELYPALGLLHLERILLVFVVISFVMNRSRLRFPPITKKFLAYYAVMLIATPFAFWVSNSIQFDIAFFEVVVYHVLLVSLLTSQERLRKYLLLYVGLIAWIGATSLYEYHVGVRVFTMGIERAEGLTSAGGDPDTLAITMAITIPFAFLLMGKGVSKAVRIYGLIVLAIYLATIIDTGSRNAFLALIVCLFISVFQRRRNWKFLPLVLVALPLLWMVIPQQYKARYESIETRNQDESYTNRLLSWQGGVKMFLHNPVTGVGPDNYTFANGMKYWPGNPRHWLNAHSLYFKLLGELGILGILTFFTYLVAVIRMNWKLARRLKKEKLDPILQNFPFACNVSLYLLLFTGYAAHNNYRSTWYTLGATTAALALLKPAQETSPATGTTKPVRLPAWVPAKKSPEIQPAEPETALA